MSGHRKRSTLYRQQKVVDGRERKSHGVRCTVLYDTDAVDVPEIPRRVLDSWAYPNKHPWNSELETIANEWLDSALRAMQRGRGGRVIGLYREVI